MARATWEKSCLRKKEERGERVEAKEEKFLAVIKYHTLQIAGFKANSEWPPEWRCV